MKEPVVATEQLSVEPSSLDPISRTTEILFGLIMVLTFTCSLSAASAGRSDVREMLIGALGCNLAWGVIDAFFYLLSMAAQRGRERLLVQKLKNIRDQQDASKLFQDIIPESIIGSISSESFVEIRTHLLRNEANQLGSILTLSDLKAALLIFALVFLSTFPVAIPFLLMHEVHIALRISNLIALLLLFALGYSLGHYAGRRPLIWGTSLTVIGVLLVSITIALGG